MSFNGEEDRRDKLYELSDQIQLQSSSNQNESINENLIKIGNELTSQSSILVTIAKQILNYPPAQNEHFDLLRALTLIKKPKDTKKRVVDKTFWIWVIQSVQNNLKMGKQGLNWRKLFFFGDNFYMLPILLNTYLDFDLKKYSEFKEIWHQLEGIITDWLLNPGDTMTFQTKLESFYQQLSPLLKDEWLTMLAKRAFGDEPSGFIFQNKFAAFWNALKDGLKPGIEFILKDHQHDMEKLKLENEQLLRIEQEIDKIDQFAGKMEKYQQSVEQIERMIEEYRKLNDEDDKLDLLAQINDKSDEVLEENKELSDFIRTKTTDLESALALLMRKRYNMRSVETLPFLSIFIGVLLNSVEQDEARRSLIDAQFVDLIAQQSNRTIMTLNQDMDNVIQRKARILKYINRLTKQSKQFEAIQSRDKSCTLWVKGELNICN